MLGLVSLFLEIQFPPAVDSSRDSDRQFLQVLRASLIFANVALLLTSLSTSATLLAEVLDSNDSVEFFMSSSAVALAALHPVHLVVYFSLLAFEAVSELDVLYFLDQARKRVFKVDFYLRNEHLWLLGLGSVRRRKKAVEFP